MSQRRARMTKARAAVAGELVTALFELVFGNDWSLQ